MSKQTNDFQGLIAHIYQQITPKGGEVVESAMVYDKDAETLREVDILIKHKHAGHEYSCMVECRDRSRVETVEWMDSLVGKSQSLNVHKIVAVCKKGFAASALRKARKYGIDTLTLNKAKETDWGEFPFKLGVLLVSPETYQIHDVLYKKNDAFISFNQSSLDGNAQVGGEDVGNLKRFIEDFFRETVVPKIEAYRKENYINIFKTKEDAEKGVLAVETEYTFPDIKAVELNGESVTFNVLQFRVMGTRRTADVKQDHMTFNNKAVSVGEHTDADGTRFDIKAIQDPETRQIHVTLKKS